VGWSRRTGVDLDRLADAAVPLASLVDEVAPTVGAT
jgi:hypothetical protein